MRKRVPSFWWDFHWEKNRIVSIIVESDEPQYPILAEFTIHRDDAMEEIGKAEKIIDDLESGRLTLKKALADYKNV